MNKVRSKSVGASFQAQQQTRQRWMDVLKKILIAGLALWALGGLILGILIFNISKELPDVSRIATYIPSETTKIYSADSVVLAELHREENRILTPLENISPILQKSVVALEDTDFYKHHGINFKGILRAMVVNLRAGGFVQGGSTLTQQLARNLFLTRRRKISRKIAEAILAIQIERAYGKDEILEMYLNQVYWGHNAYGIESATKKYFAKSSKNLSMAESALLVGMLKGPELYSPLRNFALSKKRQKTVLGRLTKVGLITPEEARDAYSEELLIAEQKTFKYKAPFFTSQVVKKLIEMYGEESTYTSGMKVYTTVDYALQQKAAAVVQKYVDKAKQPHWIKGVKENGLNFTQGAILSLEPATGYIKVLQGGVDFKENEFNRCVQAKRQPGSAFKPFVYLAALSKGFSPGTFIEDAPVTFNTIEGPYSPLNYDLKYRGNLPMRKALERSVNVVAIKLNDLVSPKYVVETAQKIGITSPLKPVLSLPLGANEVTMLELASCYGVFANGGIRVEPTMITRIEDRDGTLLYEHKIEEKKVFNENIIAALVEMMKGVVKYGTGRNANLPRPIAGKTGTTSDYKDAWFFGFTPQLVTAAWVGNDDNLPMNNITGGWVPALMWREFMIEALSKVKTLDFPRPRGMVLRKVNWETGLLANEFSPPDSVTQEKYWRGKEPTESDSYNTQQNGQSSGSTNDESDPLLDFFKM